MLDEPALNDMVAHTGSLWWYGFQHGIAILAHAAPVAYLMGKRTVYMASTYSAADRDVRCASYSTIDEKVRFAGTRVVHDGFHVTRQDKVEAIAGWCGDAGRQMDLHVCWASDGGGNCCECEKCRRTIMGLYAAGADPSRFGFRYRDFGAVMLEAREHAGELLDRWSLWYAPILEAMHARYPPEAVHPALRWFYDLKGDDIPEVAEWHARAVREWEARYAGLHDWVEQLQAGKDWLEAQYLRLSREEE